MVFTEWNLPPAAEIQRQIPDGTAQHPVHLQDIPSQCLPGRHHLPRRTHPRKMVRKYLAATMRLNVVIVFRPFYIRA